MPTLNIKDEEAYRLARELAERHQTSMTRIVVETLRDRLVAEDEKRGSVESPSAFVDRWMRITERPNRELNEPELSQMIDELLYDETGLPK